MKTRTRIRTAGALGVAAALAAIPAAASAAPSEADVHLAWNDSRQVAKVMRVSVKPPLTDRIGRDISVSYEDGAWLITDSRGVVPHRSGFSVCVPSSPTEVRCPLDLDDPLIAQSNVHVSGGDGNDTVNLRRVPDLPGYPEAGSPNGPYYEGPARPEFFTRGGNDIVYGGHHGNNGWLGEGADKFFGGAGQDGPKYSGRGGGIEGGPGADRMTGGAGDDWLVGQGGADSITGGRGADILVGGGGNDRLNSLDGAIDWITCGAGNPKKQGIKRDGLDKRLRHKGKAIPLNCRS
jgi:hypothetical protein